MTFPSWRIPPEPSTTLKWYHLRRRVKSGKLKSPLFCGFIHIPQRGRHPWSGRSCSNRWTRAGLTLETNPTLSAQPAVPDQTARCYVTFHLLELGGENWCPPAASWSARLGTCSGWPWHLPGYATARTSRAARRDLRAGLPARHSAVRGSARDVLRPLRGKRVQAACQISVEINFASGHRPDLATDPDALADEALARWKVTAKK